MVLVDDLDGLTDVVDVARHAMAHQRGGDQGPFVESCEQAASIVTSTHVTKATTEIRTRLRSAFMLISDSWQRATDSHSPKHLCGSGISLYGG